MANNATGERKKQSVFINAADTINKTEVTITKNNALLFEIMPAGISLIAVRGFNASNRASNQRLNPIAALRANTMHNTTSKKINQKGFCFEATSGVNSVAVLTARKNPINAKGIAKIV